MLIYLTGGKTLGHITPLLNIYEYFKEKHSFVYFGLKDSLEEELCIKHNIKFIPLILKGLNRKNILKNFEVFNLIHKANIIVKKELLNKPDVIISSSGFVCIPVLYKSKNTPIYLLEQNTTLGLVNKLFLKKCNKLFLSLPIDKKIDKSILSGNFIINKDGCYDNIEFYTKKPKILLFFGSMGSSTLYNFFQENDNLFKGYKIFIVLPIKYYDKYNFTNYIKLKPIDNINNIFNKFDILITRAGATTISEIINSNTKALLIPSPNVVNNHQEKNAVLMKENYLMDYIKESDINNIEEKIKDINKYNNINKRKEFMKNDPFKILEENLKHIITNNLYENK